MADKSLLVDLVLDNPYNIVAIHLVVQDYLICELSLCVTVEQLLAELDGLGWGSADQEIALQDS